MFEKKTEINNAQIYGDMVAGNKIGLDEEGLRKILREEFLYAEPDRKRLPTTEILIEAANDLLFSSIPPSLFTLFPDAQESVREAISTLNWEKRRLSEQKTKSPRILGFTDLVALEERRHLVVAPGGAGKTHSLWHLGNKLLKSGGFIPLYISLSDFSSASEVQDFFKKKIPGYDFSVVIKHPSIVFFIDGWSQFAQLSSRSNDSECKKLLALLGQARIIATSRFTTLYDNHFSIWNLEELTNETLDSILAMGLSKASVGYPQEIREFLKLPVVLILYMLLGGKETTRGSVLRAFFRYLTYKIPNSNVVLKVMGKAAARVTLIRQSILISEFEDEISVASKELKLKNIMEVINQLGTLGNSYDVLKPVHDLYWEWLIGIGILNDWGTLNFLAACSLNTRNGIKMALESGEKPVVSDMKYILELDIVFVAMFLHYLIPKKQEEKKFLKHILEIIDNLMNSSQPIERYRGLLAALISENNILFPKALNVISEFSSQNCHFHCLENYFSPRVLWGNRADISRWLDKVAGRIYVINAIVQSGDSHWVDWIEEQFMGGKLTRGEAIRTALACTSTLPNWIEIELSALLKENGAYNLRSAAERGGNLPLAYWVKNNYEQYVNKANSTWYHLNDILVKCGNDGLFQELFEQLETFDYEVQDLLLYAFEKRGSFWIIRLQEKLFANPQKHSYHQLFSVVFSEVSDHHAKLWTLSGDERVRIHGWKTLAKKHQNELLPELIKNLPASFHEIHVVPTLKAMAELDNPPESLIFELWDRLRGNIQPMLMDDMMRVLANIYPQGVPSIAGQLKNNLRLLPVYHLTRFLQYLKEWEKKTGLQLMVKHLPNDISFVEYLCLEQLSNIQSPDFMENLIHAAESDKVLEQVVTLLRTDNTIVKQVFSRLRELQKYHRGLISYIFELPDDQGIDDIFRMFRNVFHNFPGDDLLQLFSRISRSKKKQEYFNRMLYEISQQPVGGDKRVHESLLAEVMELDECSTEQYRAMAVILNIYPPKTICEMMEVYLVAKPFKALWMIRLVEAVSNILLVNESGEWI